MLPFAELCESVSRTTKKLEKIRLVAEFLASRPVDEAAHAAVFLSGRAFPAYEEATLTVGGALLSRLLQDVTGATGHELTLAYRRHGDLGSAAFDLYNQKNIDGRKREGPMVQQGCPTLSEAKSGNELTFHELESAFRKIAASSGPAAKTPIMRDLLLRVSPLEAKYLIKFMSGDLRIGLRESLVEEAIAKAFDEPHDSVRRANMLLGDISAALRLAATHRLHEAHMRLFHPIGAMLASPTENVADALPYFPDLAQLQIEEKYDGIRAQVHCGADADSGKPRVAIFSRTMDDISATFPELAESLHRLREPVILDGEILAWEIPNDLSSLAAHSFPSSRAEGDSPESRDNAVDFDSVPLQGRHFYAASGCPTLSEASGARGGKDEREILRQMGAPSFAPGFARRVGERESRNTPTEGRALPFTHIQRRLGRKSPSADLIRQYPVAYLAFDVLYANGDLTIDKALRERREILAKVFQELAQPAPDAAFVVIPAMKTRSKKHAAQQDLFASAAAAGANTVPLPPLLLAPTYHATTADELDTLFDAAQSRGNEGLMLKDLASLYTPGRRGKSWLKVKRELATLDVVVTGVEFGHGKRAGVLSDYTFAVRAPATEPDAAKNEFQLLNVGKAYSGLTDREIAEMTEWFKAHTRQDLGYFRTVDPEIVLEVAFNNVMKSDRHESGFALRFPRIMRLRPDKPVAEIDTLDRVRDLFETQHKK